MLNLMGLGTLKSLALAGVVLSLVSGGIYIKGRLDGKSEIRAELLARSLAALKKRNEIDGSVNQASDGELCTDLGGLFIDGNCQ